MPFASNVLTGGALIRLPPFSTRPAKRRSKLGALIVKAYQLFPL